MFGKSLTDPQRIALLKAVVGFDTIMVYGLLWHLNHSEKQRKDQRRKHEMSHKINMAFIEACDPYPEIFAKVKDAIDFDMILYTNELPLS